MKPLASCLLGVALLLVVPLVHAAPKDELHAAFAKFLAAKSFRASVINANKGETLSQMSFVAPDRYRIDAKGHVSVIVGDTMYTDLGGGRLQPLPVPGVGKIAAQYRNPEFVDEIARGMQVELVGDGSLDGEPVRVYAYTMTQPVKAQCKAWISLASGLPLQVESSGSFMGHASLTRVRYSAYNDPSIHIDAP